MLFSVSLNESLIIHIMTTDQIQPVLKALRNAGVRIVALHDHMIGEEPAFYFTHF